MKSAAAVNTGKDGNTLRAAELARAFARLYGREPDGVWQAPGRVNLIGEHTDYNDGFVLPFAIDRSVLAAVRLHPPVETGQPAARIASTHVRSGEELSITELPTTGLLPGSVTGWAAYPAGVAYALGAVGVSVPGFDLLLDSNVPVGAGLSSSHAVEVAILIALSDLLGLSLDRPAMARLTQYAENEFVGAPTGIMDQSASLMGQAGGALFLDCRSLASEIVQLPLAENGLAVLVMDTGVSHAHHDGGYGARRAACRRGARDLGAGSLREVQPGTDLGGLDPEAARRVRHVLNENQRVLEAVRELRSGNIRGLGPLLTASHASLRDDFEVSCPELDLAVDSALGAGAYGARMTGGGFGGSAIALIPAELEEHVGAEVLASFAGAGFTAPSLFTVLPAAGAARIL